MTLSGGAVVAQPSLAESRNRNTICGHAEFDEMEQILRHTLTDAQILI